MQTALQSSPVVGSGLLGWLAITKLPFANLLLPALCRWVKRTIRCQDKMVQDKLEGGDSRSSAGLTATAAAYYIIKNWVPRSKC